VSERTFRRWRDRYDEEGGAGYWTVGLARRRAGGPRRGIGAAPPRALFGLHGKAFPRASGERPRLRLGYTWTKLHLQWAALVAKVSHAPIIQAFTLY